MKLVTLLGLFFLSACSTIAYRQKITQGQIGCPADKIEITDEVKAMAATWTAKCNGKTFYCSSTKGFSIGSPDQVSCKEAQSSN